jgi:mono/diheme cytochrome c family protein
MSTLVFLVIFVLIGLGVLGAAMLSGSKRNLTKLGTGSRTSRRLGIAAFFLALIVLGAGVPAAVIALDKDNNGVPGTGIDTLTASQERGRLLFGERCAACHTLVEANARANVGPNLDDLRPPKALILNAIHYGRARGNGQMPAQIYEGQDAQDVANFVVRVTGGGQ